MFWVPLLVGAAMGAGGGAKRAKVTGENPWQAALKGAALGAATGALGGAAFGGGAAAGAGTTGATTAGVGATAGTTAATTAVPAATEAAKQSLWSQLVTNLGTKGTFANDMTRQGVTAATLNNARSMVAPIQRNTTYSQPMQLAEQQPLSWGPQ